MRRATVQYAQGDREAIDELEAVARASTPERGYSTHLYFRVLNNLADARLGYDGILPGLEVAEEAVEFARRRGQLRPAMWVQASFGGVALFSLGRWDELLRLSDETVAWDREHGETQIGMRVPPFAAMALAYRGELSSAAALVGDCLPRARTAGPQSQVPALAAAFVVEAARGDLDAAVALVDELERETRECDDAVRTWFAPDALRTCVRAGALELADRFAGLGGLAIPIVEHSVVTGDAILAEAKGDDDEAARLYEDAANRWHTYGHVVEHALALAGLGRCRAEAQPLLDARAIFERLGAGPIVAEVDELLGATHPTQ
jgi:tetratricopeptide (TPR) repeat protein